MDPSDRWLIEAFHVALLADLRLPQGQYAIKGGLNLRLFHGSPRLSEDLDIDVGRKAPAPGTLRNTLDRALAGRPLARRLQRTGLSIVEVSKPKQTGTVQRWKVQLLAGSRPLHTKIEFSRRGLAPGVDVAFMDAEIARAHPIAAPIPLAHYGVQAAFEQKLRALVGRAEPQSRDVFDLHLLLRRAAVTVTLSEEERSLAVERALAMDFGMFRSQVLAYLPTELAGAYDSEGVWEQMVLELVRAIEGGAS